MDMGDRDPAEGTPGEERPQPGGPQPTEGPPPPPMPSGPGWSTPAAPWPPPGQGWPSAPDPAQSPIPPPPTGPPPPWPPPGQGWPAPPSPGQQSWTPPPPPPGYGYGHPGAPVPSGGFGGAGLRPRSIGELLDAAFTLYRRNFVLLVSIAAVVQLPYAVIQLVVFRATDVASHSSSVQNLNTTLGNNGTLTPAQTSQLTSDVGALAVYFGVTLLVQLIIVYPLSLAATTHAVSNRYLDLAATVGSSYRAALSMWRSLIAMVLLLGVIVGGTLGVAIVLGVASGSFGGIAVLLLMAFVFAVFVLVRATVAAQSIVIERLSGLGGLRRSWALTRRFFWRLVGILLVLVLLQLIVGSVFSLPILAVTSAVPSDVRQMISQAVSSVSAIFVVPVTLVTLTLVYYDLRIRREGFDIEMLTAAL